MASLRIVPAHSRDHKEWQNYPEGTHRAAGIYQKLSTTLPLDYGIGIEFPERIFCLTEKFLHGTRKERQELIEAKGGEVTDRVNRFVHYLVVGTMSSQDWKYSSFGRKIERAVECRDEKGFPIRIVSEEMWLGAL